MACLEASRGCCSLIWSWVCADRWSGVLSRRVCLLTMLSFEELLSCSQGLVVVTYCDHLKGRHVSTTRPRQAFPLTYLHWSLSVVPTGSRRCKLGLENVVNFFGDIDGEAALVMWVCLRAQNPLLLVADCAHFPGRLVAPVFAIT